MRLLRVMLPAVRAWRERFGQISPSGGLGTVRPAIRILSAAFGATLMLTALGHAPARAAVSAVDALGVWTVHLTITETFDNDAWPDRAHVAIHATYDDTDSTPFVDGQAQSVGYSADAAGSIGFDPDDCGFSVTASGVDETRVPEYYGLNFKPGVLLRSRQ